MDNREILHIDMNNFYASVECLYRPELKEVPMAVAGDPKKRHGIILAKNQLAKEKGVKTAEVIWQAKNKCPNLVLVPPCYDRYHKFSRLAYEIYCEYTDQVESYGLDECYLDVSGSSRLFGSGEQIANTIKERIKNELGLTVSIGVSFNKVFAKLGSDYKKPDAITCITKNNFKDLLWKLPVRELLFVGKSTANSLEKLGIKTIGGLALCNNKILIKNFGKSGTTLWNYANGIDPSPVSNVLQHEEIKSIGNSTTLECDTKDEKEIFKIFLMLSEQVAARLRKRGLWASGIQISVKKYNMQTYQKGITLDYAVADSNSIYNEAVKLFKNMGDNSSVRSLGIRTDKFVNNPVFQCNLFDSSNDNEKAMKLESAKDLVRQKYGVNSIKRAIFY